LFLREIIERRPQIVHTWLDDINIKGGVAALLAGVPKIVVGTRSLAPNNFALFQPYMREGYRVLARSPNVCLLNNSEAGARDYERWIGIPKGSFKVVRNGFDFSAWERERFEVGAAIYRERLGIPRDALV